MSQVSAARYQLFQSNSVAAQFAFFITSARIHTGLLVFNCAQMKPPVPVPEGAPVSVTVPGGPEANVVAVHTPFAADSELPAMITIKLPAPCT